jgi:DNA-binding transcriptional regulator YiaG
VPALGTLRDWEQGKTEPMSRRGAYLTVIAPNAEAVIEALAAAERAA